MHVFISGERARSQVPAGAAGGQPLERGIRDSLREELTFLRADLELDPKAVSLDLHVGLAGERIVQFAKLLSARNAVPAFRGLLAPGRHLILKLSADWFGLVQALGALGGDAEPWRQVPEAMDALAKKTGIAVRQDLVDNLGDSLLLAVRFKLAGLLGLAGQRKGRAISDLLDGVIMLQLRDADRFFAALDGLGKQDLGLVADHSGEKRWWKLGPPELGLVLTPGRAMALLATSRDVASAAADLLEAPRKPDPRWPERIADPARQILAVDLAQLIEDFDRTPSPPRDPSAAVAKGMVSIGLAKVGKLDGLLLDAVLEDGGMRLSARLSLK